MPDQPDRPTLADELAGLIDKAAAKGVGVADDVGAYTSRDGHDLVLRRGEAALYHALLDRPALATILAGDDLDLNAVAVDALERLGRCSVARLREVAATTEPDVQTMDDARARARRLLFVVLDDALDDPGLWADAAKSAAQAYAILGGDIERKPPGPDPLAERLDAVTEAASAVVAAAVELAPKGYLGGPADPGVYDDLRTALERLGAAV